jgi:death-on-curing protein
VKYLTIQQILFIHYRVTEEAGGSHGIRDTALLESAIHRISSTFDQKDLYPDVFLKAAALMQSLIKNHPFIDGNKRTAITSASIFLSLNGRHLTADNKELELFTMKAASGKADLGAMAKWFKKKSVKV